MKFRLGTWDPLVDLSRAEQKGRLVDLLRVLCLRNGSSIVLFPHGYQSAAPVYLRGLQALIGPFRATDYWCCRSRRNLVSSLRGMFLNFTVLFLLVFIGRGFAMDVLAACSALVPLFASSFPDAPAKRVVVAL